MGTLSLCSFHPKQGSQPRACARSVFAFGGCVCSSQFLCVSPERGWMPRASSLCSYSYGVRRFCAVWSLANTEFSNCTFVFRRDCGVFPPSGKPHCWRLSSRVPCCLAGGGLGIVDSHGPKLSIGGTVRG